MGQSEYDSVLDALQRDLEGDVGPGSTFVNDVSPSFHTAQRGSNMLGNTAASDQDHGHMPVVTTVEVQCGW